MNSTTTPLSPATLSPLSYYIESAAAPEVIALAIVSVLFVVSEILGSLPPQYAMAHSISGIIVKFLLAPLIAVMRGQNPASAAVAASEAAVEVALPVVVAAQAAPTALAVATTTTPAALPTPAPPAH